MERIELHLAEVAERVLAWQCAPPESHRCKTISIGTLRDGRWWARHTGMPGGAYVVAGREAAEELAARWRSDGRTWRRVPAAYGADAQPIEPGWVRRGGSWFREDG